MIEIYSVKSKEFAWNMPDIGLFHFRTLFAGYIKREENLSRFPAAIFMKCVVYYSIHMIRSILNFDNHLLSEVHSMN